MNEKIKQTQVQIIVWALNSNLKAEVGGSL